MGMLISGLAHEIKNPLGSIKGLVQLLAEENKTEDRQKQRYLMTILKEVERLDSLMRRLLEFAYPRELKYVLSDINSMVRESALLMKPEMEKRGFILEERYDEEIPKVEMEQGGMKQALINVLKNALEATSANGKISVETTAKDDQVFISIENEGLTIPKKDIQKLFAPFYTTKEKRA